jgi:hypothetical protein
MAIPQKDKSPLRNNLIKLSDKINQQKRIQSLANLLNLDEVKKLDIPDLTKDDEELKRTSTE